MIYTVTLNPALDKTIVLDELLLGHVNRSRSSFMDIGGKGLNVSKVIKVLGGESIALGFLGADNSELFTRYLDKLEINHDFNLVQGETRTNIKIVESGTGVHTDINQRGFSITKQDIENIVSKIYYSVKCGDILVLSGSLPGGIDSGIYFRLIEMVKSKGAAVILDAEGEALRRGLEAKPDVFKPNINELRGIYSFDKSKLEEVAETSRYIVSGGTGCVVVSMGDRGAMYVSEKERLIARSMPVKVKSTVGAGDSMVAGIAYGLSRGMCTEEMFKLAVSCGTAKVMVEGTRPPERDAIYKVMDTVRVVG